MDTNENIKAKNTKKKSLPVVLFLYILLVLLACVGAYGYAKYASSQSGSSQAQVAQWRFALKNINGDSTATAQSGTISFPVTRTDDNKKIDSGKIAPETYGRFDVIIDTKGTQVSYRYDINITVNNCPKNLKFYEDKEHQTEITTTRTPQNPQPEDTKTATFTISKYVPLNRANEEHKEIIYWNWPYETGTGDAVNTNDLFDTADMEKNVTMNIAVTCTQVTSQPVGILAVGEKKQDVSIVKFQEIDMSLVDSTSATVIKGQEAEVNLGYTQTPPPANLEDLAISSSNSSVATARIDTTTNKVIISGLSVGNATITLRGEQSWNIEKTINVTVDMLHASDVLQVNENGATAAEKSPYVNYVDANGTTRLCRVLYNDASHGLQIITNGSVEKVGLGTADSNYTTGTDIEKAQNSYNNLVVNLNNKAESYNNATYSSDARCIGSTATVTNGMMANKDDEELLTNPNNYSYLNTYVTQGFKGDDTHYTDDSNKMNSLGIRNIGTNYWLASRYVNSDSSYSYFNARYVNSSGNVSSLILWYVGSGGSTYVIGRANGVRPVFLLKSNVIITGGTGVEGDPYVLGVE